MHGVTAAPAAAPPYGKPPAVPGNVCSLAASDMKSAKGTSHTCQHHDNCAIEDHKLSVSVIDRKENIQVRGRHA